MRAIPSIIIIFRFISTSSFKFITIASCTCTSVKRFIESIVTFIFYSIANLIRVGITVCSNKLSSDNCLPIFATHGYSTGAFVYGSHICIAATILDGAFSSLGSTCSFIALKSLTVFHGNYRVFFPFCKSNSSSYLTRVLLLVDLNSCSRSRKKEPRGAIILYFPFCKCAIKKELNICIASRFDETNICDFRCSL